MYKFGSRGDLSNPTAGAKEMVLFYLLLCNAPVNPVVFFRVNPVVLFRVGT
jgi:hypothetical protein